MIDVVVMRHEATLLVNKVSQFFINQSINSHHVKTAIPSRDGNDLQDTTNNNGVWYSRHNNFKNSKSIKPIAQCRSGKVSKID